VTFSCYLRQAYLKAPAARDLFEDALERIRCRYEFEVIGYVVMPEHVHLLVNEPRTRSLAIGLQALKLSLARRSGPGRFWQERYYDFNVFTEDKRVEKLDYMHWNPVRRGLVATMQQWPWSSYRYYRTREQGKVHVDSTWTNHYMPD
jgi:putative transposase